LRTGFYCRCILVFATLSDTQVRGLVVSLLA